MVWAILNNDIHKAINEFIDNPSDRVVAVLGGAVLEEALRRAIELRLRPGKTLEKGLGAGGFLGDFSSKIRLGYLLYMYEKPALHALEGLSEIRNIFAHQLTVTAFFDASAEMSNSFAKLSLHTAYTKYPHPLFDGDSEFAVEAVRERRDILITNLKLLLALLMRDTNLHRPYTNEAAPLPRRPVSLA